MRLTVDPEAQREEWLEAERVRRAACEQAPDSDQLRAMRRRHVATEVDHYDRSRQAKRRA